VNGRTGGPTRVKFLRNRRKEGKILLHKDRKWCVTDVNSAEKLAEMLTEQTFTLCSGFRYGGYLFLNDSFSEDGAQEYGVIKEATGKQIESITFSWCNHEEALRLIRDIAQGDYDSEEWNSGINLAAQIQSSEQHGTCPLCA
jgi:hypothetical protein